MLSPVRPDLTLLLCVTIICGCIELARGRARVGTASAARRAVGPYKVPSGPKSFCTTCDIRNCPQITPEMCSGKLVKDDCGCCPKCDLSQKSADIVSSTNTSLTCNNVACPGSEVCMLNIQGIPICRCPSVFVCRRQGRRDVCGRDGKTYKSKCYLKVAECAQNKKIRVAHKGVCVPDSPPEKRGKKKHREPFSRRNRRRRKQKGPGKKGTGKKERGQNRRPKRDHEHKQKDRLHQRHRQYLSRSP